MNSTSGSSCSMVESANPQDAQRKPEDLSKICAVGTPRLITAAAAAAASSVATPASSKMAMMSSGRRSKRRSLLLSKAQHIPSPGTCPGAGERAPLSPQRSFRLSRLMGQESPLKYERLSQRRLQVQELEPDLDTTNTNTTTNSKPKHPKGHAPPPQQQEQHPLDYHSSSSTEAETSSIEEPETSSVTKLVDSSSVSTPQHHHAARRIQRVTRQFSNQNKVRRAAQLNEFQRLQKKQEEEYKRIERIRARGRHEPIRTSLKHYHQTVQTNQKYGFTEGGELSSKPIAPRRKLSSDANLVKTAAEARPKVAYDDGADDDDDDDRSNGEKSLTLDQLQQDKECEKFLKKMPMRRRSNGSNDSTLSSLKLGDLAVKKEQSKCKSSTAEFPVPVEIMVADNNNNSMQESEISLQASWDNIKAETRWNAQPPIKKAAPNSTFERIIFHRPVPAILKKPTEDDRCAVHPRVVYGKPKTEKAIQAQPNERWAASSPLRTNKLNNASRWAAQPKKSFPVNISRMPKRKKSDDALNAAANKPHMPRRQDSQDEDATTNTPPPPNTPRRGRRRSLKEVKTTAPLPSKPLTAPPVLRTNSRDMLCIPTPHKPKRPTRTMSLGEVKKMVSATRIQSLFRMYRERQYYKIRLQQQRKEEIERELERELHDIHASLKSRQESIRSRMERGFQAGVVVVANNYEPDSVFNLTNQDEIIVTLKEEVAELERCKSKLTLQCDRLRSHNKRLETGNKARETAVKEVQGRLSKLQQIQIKLNRVKENFQTEYMLSSAEMDQTNEKLIAESKLQERTLSCIRNIINHVRPKVSEQLMEELEDMVPIVCLM